MKNIDVSFLRSRRAIAAIAAVLLLPATAACAAPSTTWTGAPGGNWSDSSNWSNGIVPGSGVLSPEIVTIGSATDSVAFDGTYEIKRLINNGGLVTDGYGTGQLTVDGGIGNKGAIVSADYSDLTLSSGADTRNDGLIEGFNHSTLGLTVGGDLHNSGLILADNSDLTIDVAGNLNNSATGDISSHFISNTSVTVGGNLNNAGHLGASYSFGEPTAEGFFVSGNVHNTGSIDSMYGGTTIVFNPDGSLTNNGEIDAQSQGGTVVVAGNIKNYGSIYAIRGAGASINSLSNLTNNGSMSASYGSELDASASYNIHNHGDVNASQGSTIVFNADGAITNHSDGTITATQGSEVDLLAGGDIKNHGAITASQGGVVYINTTGGLVYNRGSITTNTGGEVVVTSDLIQTGGQIKNDGTLDLNDGAGTLYLEKGSLGGGGVINGSVEQDGGTFAPGDPTTTTVTGDYIKNGGKTVFVIDGYNDYDKIAVGGDYTYLGGELDFEFSNSFLAGLYSGPHSFDFLSFANFYNLSGGPLDIVTNLSPQYGFSFDPSTPDGTARGVLTGGTVPEPNAGVILLTAASGLSILLWRARRRTIAA